MPNETPFAWAERMLSTVILNGVTFSQAEVLAELAAIKRKADAADLWRAEALAARKAAGSWDPRTVEPWIAARTARINAGLT